MYHGAACGLIPLLFTPGSDSLSVQAYCLCNIPENAVAFPVFAYAIIIGKKHWIVNVLLYMCFYICAFIYVPFKMHLSLNSSFHHTGLLELLQYQVQDMIGMITRVVPASITGHGVDNPSLTGSSDIVTISVYFACFLK